MENIIIVRYDVTTALSHRSKQPFLPICFDFHYILIYLSSSPRLWMGVPSLWPLYIPPTSSRADRLIHPLKRIPDRSEIKIRAMWHRRRRLLINHRRLSWMQFSSLLDYMGGRPGHALHRNDRHLEISSPRRRIFYILATSQIAIASLTRIFAKGVPRAQN